MNSSLMHDINEFNAMDDSGKLNEIDRFIKSQRDIVEDNLASYRAINAVNYTKPKLEIEKKQIPIDNTIGGLDESEEPVTIFLF
jgi:hypothetical protein